MKILNGIPKTEKYFSNINLSNQKNQSKKPSKYLPNYQSTASAIVPKDRLKSKVSSGTQKKQKNVHYIPTVLPLGMSKTETNQQSVAPAVQNSQLFDENIAQDSEDEKDDVMSSSQASEADPDLHPEPLSECSSNQSPQIQTQAPE